jgi:hypothetical protein
MAFSIGQKVVYLGDPDQRELHPCEVVPEVGPVYTVRWVGESDYGRPALRLVEIVNPEMHYSRGVSELCFPMGRFRPVVERKTDISVFERLLDTTKYRETAL